MNLKHFEKTVGKAYSAPDCETIELGLEGSMMTGSNKYGQAGRAGRDLEELDELEF